MGKILRYQIADWSQIIECLSNNSKNLYLSLVEHLDGDILTGQVLQVNHTNYGTLFAAMIQGSGTLITATNEEGEDLPFLTTEQILDQIMKFGFYVKYDVKSNLPSEIIAYLSELYNLGYDKINRLTVQLKNKGETLIRKSRVVVFKTDKQTTDILTFGKVISRAALDRKLEKNLVLDITEECEGRWDWVTYAANISDILDENIDPVDEYETSSDVSTHDMHPFVPEDGQELTEADLIPEGMTLTPYVDPEVEGEDDPE